MNPTLVMSRSVSYMNVYKKETIFNQINTFVSICFFECYCFLLLLCKIKNTSSACSESQYIIKLMLISHFIVVACCFCHQCEKNCQRLSYKKKTFFIVLSLLSLSLLVYKRKMLVFPLAACMLPAIIFVVDDIYPLCAIYPRLLYSRVLFNKNIL